MNVVLVKEKIEREVVEWLCDGYPINKITEQTVAFLRHLMALREACAKPDSVVILEPDLVISKDFIEVMQQAIAKIPSVCNICLLSPFVTSWDGIGEIVSFELSQTKYSLCTVTGNVYYSFGYWIRAGYVEYLLAMFDRPLKNICHFDLSPEKISRTGNVCLLKPPIVASIKTQQIKDYYLKWGFQLN